MMILYHTHHLHRRPSHPNRLYLERNRQTFRWGITITINSSQPPPSHALDKHPTSRRTLRNYTGNDRPCSPIRSLVIVTFLCASLPPSHLTAAAPSSAHDRLSLRPTTTLRSPTNSADNSAKKQTGDPRKRLEEYVPRARVWLSSSSWSSSSWVVGLARELYLPRFLLFSRLLLLFSGLDPPLAIEPLSRPNRFGPHDRSVLNRPSFRPATDIIKRQPPRSAPLG